MTIREQLQAAQEAAWLNPEKIKVAEREKICGHGFVEVKAAQNRFMRFLPFIRSRFPETEDRKGVIESRLLVIPEMTAWLKENGAAVSGRILLKDDAHLPVAGSVKARGGIHEVLKIAEQLAFKAKILHPTDKYDKLDSEEFRQFYSRYTIQVGSTGNLGLSIGIMGASLGFRVIVHMSREAKEWKKELLREKGVIVLEYDGDYSHAVAEGRNNSAKDPNSFFIDDENSEDLFFGYATAGMRLKMQLYKAGVSVDRDHPLFVYLPCGVGGAPGGITYGLKQMFGDNVHCFFVEPVQDPCMLLGMSSGKYEEISVEEIGLGGQTAADGLAVGRPSAFVSKMMRPLLSGCFTVKDEHLLTWMKTMYEKEHLFLEPSACAGFQGLTQIENPDSVCRNYLENNHLTDKMPNATHIIWATGGGLVPTTEQTHLLSL